MSVPINLKDYTVYMLKRFKIKKARCGSGSCLYSQHSVGRDKQICEFQARDTQKNSIQK